MFPKTAINASDAKSGLLCFLQFQNTVISINSAIQCENFYTHLKEFFKITQSLMRSIHKYSEQFLTLLNILRVRQVG